jgi:hypothetical protein
MLKKKIHGYSCNLFLDTNVNEKLWIHKCKDAWKQIQKCMNEFMDTNSKIFGYKWENAKMHGLQNVKVFMDTKCKDSWIWAWKQIYAKMHRNKCKERYMDIKSHKISGYKCKDTWMQNANIHGYRNAKMHGYKCKDSRIPKCKDARIQIRKNFQIQMLQRCTWKQMQRFLDANAKKLRYKCKTILDTNVEKMCVDTNCKDSCI